MWSGRSVPKALFTAPPGSVGGNYRTRRPEASQLGTPQCCLTRARYRKARFVWSAGSALVLGSATPLPQPECWLA